METRESAGEVTSIPARLGTAASRSRALWSRYTRAQRAWFLYECGAQGFTTSVVGVFLGPFMTAVAATAAGADGSVWLLWIPIRAGSFFAYAVSFSVALQALFLPLLGALADSAAHKVRYLTISALLGATACAALFAVTRDEWILAGILFVTANVAFGAASAFYNALLGVVAPPQRRAAVSSAGWSVGYVGGGVLLIAHLALLTNASRLGLDEQTAVRVAILTAGLWWAAFTLRSVVALRYHERRTRAASRPAVAAVGALRSTIRGLRKRPHTVLFLVAFLLYSDAVQTVTVVATVFGTEEIGMSISDLVLVMLMIQFVGAGGTLLCRRIADRFGLKPTIVVTLIVWTGTMFYAFGLLETSFDFVILAFVIALVVGGTQALSRAAFSRMIPRGREAEYFGIYAVSERSTSWLGPLLFGLALQLSGSYRLAILSLTLLFGAGLALLSFVSFRRAYIEGLRGALPPSDSVSTSQ
jgi:UMF1 family MFS transporter